MGWRLAEEVAWARPARAGLEWWTLLDIAQDARDDTRRGMPGQDYLMRRAKISKPTLYRRLQALEKAGLLVKVRHPGPKKRAVYEIPVLWTSVGQVSASVTPDRVSATATPVVENPTGPENEQVSATATPVQVSTMVRPPPSVTPSTSSGSVSPPSLEGGWRGAAGLRPKMSTIEKAAWQAAESRCLRSETDNTGTDEGVSNA